MSQHLAKQAGPTPVTAIAGATPAADSATARAIGCTVLGGYGQGFIEGQGCFLDVHVEAVVLRPDGLGDPLSAGWSDLLALEIGGRGQLTSGGGYLEGQGSPARR